jgi:ATP-dependent exoDNAse (exonuclease V) alpha subunit
MLIKVKKGRNLLIHGKAGTGKSTMLRNIVDKIPNSVVLSPTGIAALNVGGQTIHSFFGFSLGYMQKQQVRGCTRQIPILEKSPLLIIDEISMVRSDIFDAINISLQKALGNIWPFGGIQVLLFGDTGQLPPVVGSSESHLFREDNVMFFMSDSYKNGDFEKIELEHVYRQSNYEFVDILSKLRTRTIKYSEFTDFNGKLNVRGTSEVLNINDCTVLCMTNRVADEFNIVKYNEINSPEFQYKASITGVFSEKEHPTQETLCLKVGAKVVMIRNDKEHRWVNGTIAVVSKLDSYKVWVKINGVETDVSPETWEKCKYTANNKEVIREVVGSFKQVPMKLAWAITTHKSQGMTLPKVHIDLQHPPFEHGQLYVALSRAREIEDISLSRPLVPTDVCTNKNFII